VNFVAVAAVVVADVAAGALVIESRLRLREPLGRPGRRFSGTAAAAAEAEAAGWAPNAAGFAAAAAPGADVSCVGLF
jgi:hypothetical protein